MINKEKVSEILSDMKEEERKKQEAIQKEVNDFLENRLEYYVAMVMNGNIYNESWLIGMLNRDGCKFAFRAKERINKALEEFDWYLCSRWEYVFDTCCYMNVLDAPIDICQPENVIKRQIELGLRKEDKEDKEKYFAVSCKLFLTILATILLAVLLCHH